MTRCAALFWGLARCLTISSYYGSSPLSPCRPERSRALKLRPPEVGFAPANFPGCRQAQCRGAALIDRYRHTHLVWTHSLGHSLQRPSKRQLVAIRIEHVEIAFTPRRVPWDFRIKSFLPQMCPERIHIRNVEDQ